MNIFPYCNIKRYTIESLAMDTVKFFLLTILLGSLISCKSSTSNDDDNDNVDLNGYNETGFFKTNGQEILNRQGEPVVIKGFGLGGWLLPEGYMFRINRHGYTSASQIQENVIDLIGASDAEDWIQLFRDNYVQEKDIIQMKEWGADHIRVPFHYNLFYDIDTDEFVDEGFDRIDELLIWCKRNRMDIILDMHATPGAQSEGDIADSDGEARLWTEPNTYWPITIKIWEEIARRYKDENIIIGYDLINEPVTPFEESVGNPMLGRLYTQLTTAIRKIDTNHILFIEGNYFATSFAYLTPPFDDNMVYAFHKYWNETDQGTIQYLLNIRSTHNVPLWLGESGENSNPWFRETIDLMEQHSIGWNWWTHKKLETITSPLSSSTNANYNKVTSYWNDGAARPTTAEAREGLFQMAEDLHIDNTTTRPDVIAALFSPSFNSSGIPYTENKIPGNIEAVHYDIGNNGVSYFDTEYKRVSSDENQNTGNSGWEYRNDGVDIEKNEDLSPKYNVGFVDTGDWMDYTVEVTAGTYDVSVIAASGIDGSRFRVLFDGKLVGNVVDVPNTGGYQNWRNITVGSHTFEGGTHTLRVNAVVGGYNISLISIK